MSRIARLGARAGGALTDLAATATQEPLRRVVDQLRLPSVELVEPDVASDQRRIEGPGEIEREAGIHHEGRTSGRWCWEAPLPVLEG
jgi:hypothetical protein